MEVAEVQEVAESQLGESVEIDAVEPEKGDSDVEMNPQRESR